MNILYVVSRPLEINTSASIRNRATIEGLLELGHSVDLLTTEYDKNHANYDNSLSSNSLNVRYLKLGGIQDLLKVGRRFNLAQPIKTFAYRMISKFEIYDNLKGIANYASKINISDDNYDMIISSSDPKSSHLFVSKMFEKRIIKNTYWIQIWGDPFLEDITRKNKLLNYIIKKEEKRLLRYAKKVVYVSNLTLLTQQRLYPQFSMKMFYEAIPYAKKLIYPVEQKYKESLTFLYCGDYSSSVRDIKPLYEAIKNSNNKLIICGNSNIKLEDTDRIKIFSRVNFEKIREFESKCDVLVHLSNLKGTQIPGKIYQYSGTNKIILFILDGEKEAIYSTFARYERYVFCQNNKESIGEEIEQITTGVYNNTQFVVEDFSPQKIANRILNI